MRKTKQLINNLIGKTGYKLTKAENLDYDPIIDNDTDFMCIYKDIQEFTMTSKIQCFSLYMSVKYIIKAEIQGDFVECGVWKGGNCMLIAKTLQLLNVTERKIYLYDTFEGMAEPKSIDFSNESPDDKAITLWKKHAKEDHNEWCYASLDEVKRNLTSSNYPAKNIIYVKGKVEETIPETIPEKVSILRLDTDWYDSTRHELKYLYPLVEKNGLLLIDDYGTWSGSKKAVDEFFENEPVLLNRIDAGNRLVIKPN